ncbi:hypothetical protein Tco_1226093 [Tanacetum coccineum]
MCDRCFRKSRQVRIRRWLDNDPWPVTLAERQAENKRKLDNNNQSNNNFQEAECVKLTPLGWLKGRVGPFKVLEQVESVAYKLKLPQELSRVYNMFHVSNLKKYYPDDPLVVPLEGLHVDEKLHFVEKPVEIMD